MKIPAMTVVVLTTLLLFVLTVLVSFDTPFHWVFYLTVLGQAMVIWMVYKVLTDDYSTKKTFRQGYEDRPLTEDLE